MGDARGAKMKGSWRGRCSRCDWKRGQESAQHTPVASAERGAEEAVRWEQACFWGQEGLQLSEGGGGQIARPQRAGEHLSASDIDYGTPGRSGPRDTRPEADFLFRNCLL